MPNLKLWILSDLHIEQSIWDLPEPHPEYDVLVAAGDIHTASDGVRWLAERARGRPVIYVPGNHEWYQRTMPDEAESAAEAARELGVHFLMDRAVAIGDVRFLGATLWTDYELHSQFPGRAMDLARMRLNDHRLINVRTGELFDPEDARQMHMASRKWLAETLAQRPAGIRRNVVVTHHLPDRRSIDPQYGGDPLNAAFASDLCGLVETGGADLWIHGHTHSSCDYRLGRCRVVCNPKGYGPRRASGSIENPRFDSRLIIEI